MIEMKETMKIVGSKFNTKFSSDVEYYMKMSIEERDLYLFMRGGFAAK